MNNVRVPNKSVNLEESVTYTKGEIDQAHRTRKNIWTGTVLYFTQDGITYGQVPVPYGCHIHMDRYRTLLMTE